jgi:hypothetical protein
VIEMGKHPSGQQIIKAGAGRRLSVHQGIGLSDYQEVGIRPMPAEGLRPAGGTPGYQVESISETDFPDVRFS